MKERIQSARAAEITGLSIRTVQHLASGGKVPGAAMLSRRWTFDEAKLRHWIASREAAAVQQVAVSVPALRKSAIPPSCSPLINETYDRLLGRKRTGHGT